MKTYRKACWLLLWDQSRANSRGDFDHLRLPRFVGTLPNQMSTASVATVLPALLLSHAPVMIAMKVECGKSLRSGQPKLEHCKDFPSDTVTCSFGRLVLVARRVRELRVVDGAKDIEVLEWLEERRYRPDPDDFTSPGEEITPERRRSLTQQKHSHPIA